MRAPLRIHTLPGIATAIAAWGAVALLISLAHVTRPVAGIVAGSFVLLGPGVALVLAMGIHGKGQVALGLAMAIGFGAGAAALAGQLLVLVGWFSPSAVVGVQLVLTVLLLTSWRRADV